MLAKAKTYKPYFLLFVFCIVAYLPLSSFLFSLKNDAFIYNFPNKFFFSECIRNGYLPTWNPYLNFGFPLYADPGFAWWNPITWLFGIAGYNAYTFTIEVLLYIYLSGAGMYWLGHCFLLNKKTKFVLACMFMCCGFFVGNLQHINFITCASFIPWLTAAWIKYQHKPVFKNMVLCGLFGYLLFTGGHPAIPIATLYFFLVLTILYYLYFKKEVKLPTYLISQIKLVLLFGVLLSPLLYSYLTILPYYSRSEPVNQTLSTGVGFTLNSYLSFFLPFATIKNQDFFATDVSMRNGYFSLFGIVLFLQFLLQKNKKAIENVFLLAGLFMLVIAAGGATKKIVYESLPGLNFVKTNGEFRVFAIFCFITCIAYPVNQISDFALNRIQSTKKVFKWLFIILFIAFICFLVFFHDSVIISSFNVEGIKVLLANLSFIASVKIALFVAVFLSIFYWFALKYFFNKNILVVIILIDIIINTWILLPITGVGKTSVSKMQSVIDKSPKGFPIKNLSQNFEQLKISKEEELLIGNWSWYDKAIIHKPIDYPSQLKSGTSIIYPNSGKSVTFLKNERDSAVIYTFTPNKIKISAQLSKPDTLVLRQNYFPGWSARSLEKRYKVFQADSNFIGIQLPAGLHEIIFSFSIIH